MVKIERVDNEITKELNVIIGRDLKDPRLAETIVSVTAVETSKDLKTAKVFVSIMDESAVKGVLNALNGASAYIRGLLFDRLRIRTVPHMTFVKDNSISHSYKIEKILKSLNIDHSEQTEGEGEND